MQTAPKNIPKKFWAGGFLYNSSTNAIFLHLRDGSTKFNPNMWAFFGGLNEGGESPAECFTRELKEEIGLEVPINKVAPLREYLNVELNTYRYVFFVDMAVNITTLVLGEGAGFSWVLLSSLAEYNLTEKTSQDLEYFVQQFRNTL